MRTAAGRLMDRTGASAAWTPASLPNLVGWYDPSNAASITSSGSPAKVSQLNDLSGVGNHATAAGTTKPTTGTATINSLNVLVYDGSDDCLLLPNLLSGATEASALWVAKCTNDPSTNSKPGPVVGRFGTNPFADLHPYADGHIYDGFASTTRKDCGDPSPSLASAWQGSVVSAASDYRFYVNASSLFSTATNTVAIGGYPVIGGTDNSGLAEPQPVDFCFEGQIAEVIVCSSALSTTDRQLGEAYLKAKWGTP